MTSRDIGRLNEFPTVEVGRWPTPVAFVPRRGASEILVKRDDMSGHGRGGVKIRKIECIVGYMLARGHRELITAVGNITNLVHDVVPVLRRFGLGWRIFVADDPRMPARDRDEIFRAIRDDVQFLGPTRVQVAGRMLAALAGGRARHRHPFAVLPSLMHPAGVVGSARGFVEMVSQLRDAGLPVPSTVFITVASGTTLAGFLIAEHALRLGGVPPIRVVGVQVYPGQARLWTLGLVRWTERFLGLRGRVPRERVEVVAGRLCGGFGRYPEQLADLCDRVQTDCRLNVDPIFGGKTWSEMESQLRDRKRADDRPVLYWHCGYTPDWRSVGTAVRIGGASST